MKTNKLIVFFTVMILLLTWSVAVFAAEDGDFCKEAQKAEQSGCLAGSTEKVYKKFAFGACAQKLLGGGSCYNNDYVLTIVMWKVNDFCEKIPGSDETNATWGCSGAVTPVP